MMDLGLEILVGIVALVSFWGWMQALSRVRDLEIERDDLQEELRGRMGEEFEARWAEDDR